MSSSSSSNSNVSISDIVNAKIIELLLECCRKTVLECSQLYGFSSEEALNKMGLYNNLYVNDSKSDSDVSSVKSEVEVEVDVEVEVEVSKNVTIPLPFNGTCDDTKCQGLKQNHGLYTQCTSKKQKEKEFCKTCEKQTEKNTLLGTMKERMAVGIMEFKDNKGKSPTSYMTVLNKLKITKEEAEKEAGNKKVSINSIHWVEEEKKKKVTKKAPKEEGEAVPKEVKKKVTKKAVKKEEAAPKEEGEAAPKEEGEAAPKEEDEAAPKEEKKKVQRKKKENKEQEEGSTTSSKKEKVVKGEKGRPKKEKKETEIASPIDDLFANLVAKEEEPPQVDVVNKIEFQGMSYLKSKTTGVIYNMDQDQVGKWNDNTSTIDFDEEEEEYEDE